MKKTNNQRYDQYKERLGIALKAANICIFEVDLKKQLYTSFENPEDIFHVSEEKILQDVRPFSQLPPSEYQKAVSEYFSHPDDAETIAQAFQRMFKGQSTTYQARMRAGGSDFVWCKLDVAPIMENGEPIKMIGVITDISSMKARTDYLENEVGLDPFTGLYNKKRSIQLIEQALQVHSNAKHALAITDIDNFKFFNDTYGHAVGDKIIHAVSDSLKLHFSKSSILGRFGGDEFILFIQDISDLNHLIFDFQKILTCTYEQYTCTNSIGVALFPDDAKDFTSLFKKADDALYRSKLTKHTLSFASEYES